MIEFWRAPWFGWAVALVIALPVLLIVLTELGAWLQRRGNAAGKPVLFLRNAVVPVGALLAVLVIASDLESQTELTWVRVVATVFGFLVILLLLSSVNSLVFGNARPGSWRDRLPSIFVDLGRLALIVVGLAVLFSWVWGADVGGLFAALGVTSIVIGLALQNAVGSVISGLLLLFEQPFKLGDWLDTSQGRGRVIGVNWRAVHLETDDGTLVIPTGQLADSAFTNVSEPTSAHTVSVTLDFGPADAPHAVVALLLQVAADIPVADAGRAPSVLLVAPGSYRVDIPVLSPSDEEAARSILLGWLWYAATRAGLHWSGAPADELAALDSDAAALAVVARTLRLPAAAIEPVAARVVLQRYAAGEQIKRATEIPLGMGIVIDGTVGLSAPIGEGSVRLETLDAGSLVGQTALTHEPSGADAVALSPVTIASIQRDDIAALVAATPALGTRIGQAIDRRRQLIDEARVSVEAPTAIDPA